MRKDPKTLFTGKNVLIHGLGLNNGGVNLVKYIAQFDCNIRITDLKDAKTLKPSLQQIDDLIKEKNIQLILGEHREEDFKWADIVIRNPAIPVGNKFIQIAKQNGAKIFMDISLFLQISNNTVIGITGTKGKSTTTTLIYEILKTHFDKLSANSSKKLKKTAYLAGNIGVPPITLMDKLNPDDIVVLELSSFQLYGMGLNKQSPHIAVLTNMYTDHINWHKTFDHYLESKLQITKWQTNNDYLIVNLDSPHIDKFLNASKAKKIGVSFNKNKVLEYLHSGKIEKGLYYQDNKIYVVDKKQDNLLLDLSKIDLKLKGKHNVYNIMEAISATYLTDMFVSLDSIKQVLETFSGAYGRQQLIRTIDNIDIYNDTAATADVAIEAALDRFGEEYDSNVVYIMGGVDKGIDYSRVLKGAKNKLKAVVLLEGTASEKIKTILEEQGVEVYAFFGDFEEAIKKAYKLARKIAENIKVGEGQNAAKSKKVAMVLTPGGSSFNMFLNEWDRGRQFDEFVAKL